MGPFSAFFGMPMKFHSNYVRISIQFDYRDAWARVEFKHCQQCNRFESRFFLFSFILYGIEIGVCSVSYLEFTFKYRTKEERRWKTKHLNRKVDKSREFILNAYHSHSVVTHIFEYACACNTYQNSLKSINSDIAFVPAAYLFCE